MICLSWVDERNSLYTLPNKCCVVSNWPRGAGAFRISCVCKVSQAQKDVRYELPCDLNDVSHCDGRCNGDWEQMPAKQQGWLPRDGKQTKIELLEDETVLC